MNLQTNRKRIVMFSTISLTDIVLLLLIFFLLSSTYIIQPGIKVHLPKAISADVESTDRIYITITEDLDYYLNQSPVSLGELGIQLKDLMDQSPDKVVIIQADRNLALEKAIEVLDIAKIAGAERFMIATQQSSE